MWGRRRPLPNARTSDLITTPPAHNAIRRPAPPKHLPQVVDEELGHLVRRKVPAHCLLGLEDDMTGAAEPAWGCVSWAEEQE